MDTEQYEEAVRDYEKVYQTEKTKGRWADGDVQTKGEISHHFFATLQQCLLSFRTQDFIEERSAGAEKEQTERLL